MILNLEHVIYMEPATRALVFAGISHPLVLEKEDWEEVERICHDYGLYYESGEE